MARSRTYIIKLRDDERAELKKTIHIIQMTCAGWTFTLDAPAPGRENPCRI